MKRQSQESLPMSVQNTGKQKRVLPTPPSYYWWPITEAKIQSAAHKIVDSIHPDKIILFGSFSYGNPTPDSDVDLLVILESKQSAHARAAQLSQILYPRPFPVDIIVRTPSEIEERLALGDPFFHEIMTKGKILYQESSSFARISRIVSMALL